MGLRGFSCLIFITNFLFSFGLTINFINAGSLAKELEVSTHNLSASPVSLVHKRMVLYRSELKPIDAMAEDDVTTPIATVPAINPINPTGTTMPKYNPIPNPYTAPAMASPASSSGQSWCIASQSASQKALQVALDYACGFGGVDCSQIQPGGSCFNPDATRDHASYAFNNYYMKNPIPTSCDFGGTAIITNVDPSTSTCQYLSTSTSFTVLNTTNPTGSTVYGSVPPDSSGRAPMLRTVNLYLSLMNILTALNHLFSCTVS